MKLSIQFAVIFLTILLIMIGHPQAAQAADFDHSKFDQVLKTYVEARVVSTIRDCRRRCLSPVYGFFGESKADSLSRDGQLAFWIKPIMPLGSTKASNGSLKEVSAKRLSPAFGSVPSSLRPGNIPWQVNV